MDKDYLRELLSQIELELSDKQIEQLCSFYTMLVEKNKVMNLTAITEWNEVVVKHFIDSLAICNYIDLKDQSIVDIGTGAGFPGIPLKIAFPDLNIVLLDSLNKRIKFLDEVIEALGLNGISTVHGRAEELGRNLEYREKFDLCVSRAVANLSTLSEYCIPLVKVGGNFVPYKSGHIEEELVASKGAIFKLGAKVNSVKTFSLPDSDIDRSFVFIDKKDKTAKKYPRTAGKPSREPLK